jgi:hypothetical protein
MVSLDGAVATVTRRRSCYMIQTILTTAGIYVEGRRIE